MKKYNVEFKENYNGCFDNWIGDYIEAESEEEAVEFAKDYLIENGYAGNVESLFVQVEEVER